MQLSFKRFVKLEQKSFLNLVAGLSYQIISISMGLILPYLFITNLGSESNGLLSSVGQVFTCLGLLEAGVSTATIQALYKPISAKDKKNINEILSATDFYYRKTGIWYIVTVSILIIVFPYLIDSELSTRTIRLVIALQGIGAVTTYFVQAKYNLFLRAEGKNYILSLIMLVTLIVRNFGKIIAIWLGFNVVAVQIVHLSAIVLEAGIICFYIKSHYKWINLKEKPDFEAIGQKSTVFVQSVAWMVFNHTDVLLLTVITRDLKIISVYSIYSTVFETAQNIMNAARESFQYKIGRVAQQEENKLDSFFEGYSLKILALSLIVFSSVYLISSPFISLYTRNVTDIDYLIAGVSELFFVYKLLYGIRSMNRQLIEANGHFRQTQRIAILEAVLNLTISIALVYRFGIRGVLAGTVISLIVSVSWYMLYLKKNVVKAAIIAQTKYLLMCCPIIIGIILIGYFKLISVSSWTGLIFSAGGIGILLLIAFGGVLNIAMRAICKTALNNIKKEDEARED